MNTYFFTYQHLNAIHIQRDVFTLIKDLFNYILIFLKYEFEKFTRQAHLAQTKLVFNEKMMHCH